MWNVRMWGKARKGGGERRMGQGDKWNSDRGAKSRLRSPLLPATKVLSRDNVPVVVTALRVLPTHLFHRSPTWATHLAQILKFFTGINFEGKRGCLLNIVAMIWVNLCNEYLDAEAEVCFPPFHEAFGWGERLSPRHCHKNLMCTRRPGWMYSVKNIFLWDAAWIPHPFSLWPLSWVLCILLERTLPCWVIIKGYCN